MLVPSSEGESLGLFSFILRETVSFGSRSCVIDGANFNIFECYNEFDRLQLSFNTGYRYNFSFFVCVSTWHALFSKAFVCPCSWSVLIR